MITMTLVTQQKLQKSPTYQVLDAIRAATSQAAAGQVANMAYLVATTGLCGRTVNALVYALEKQHRVVAHSYEVPRREQIFSVLRYEPNDPRGGFGDRSSSRCHPAKAAKAAIPAPTFPVFEPALQHSISGNDEILAVGEPSSQHQAMAIAQVQSINRRAELCSSTVRQRSRFHHAHPANREAHRELQAVEDFELLFTSFFTAAPVATAAGEHENDAGIADEYIAVDETAVMTDDGATVTPDAQGNLPGARFSRRRMFTWAVRGGLASACHVARRRVAARRGLSVPFATAAFIGASPPGLLRRPLNQLYGGQGHILGPPKEKPPNRSEEGLGVGWSDFF